MNVSKCHESEIISDDILFHYASKSETSPIK